MHDGYLGQRSTECTYLKSDIHVILVSKLGYLAPQLHFSWMHTCSLGHPKCEIKLFLKISLLGLGSKWLVSLATRNLILKNWG